MRAPGRGALYAAVRLVVVVAALSLFAAWWRLQKQPDFRIDTRLRLTPDTSAAPALLALGDERRLAWAVPPGGSLRLSFTVPGEEPVLRFRDGQAERGGVLAVRLLSAGGAVQELQRHEPAVQEWAERRVPLPAGSGAKLTVELAAQTGDEAGPVCLADLVLESEGRGVDETDHPIV
ncbi:MAG TPA: hypothetical protein VFD43_00455, partial [Planctomycetota bacterium]|nr:hypothetical protein [Planctomycetota bacterium]